MPRKQPRSGENPPRHKPLVLEEEDLSPAVGIRVEGANGGDIPGHKDFSNSERATMYLAPDFSKPRLSFDEHEDFSTPAPEPAPTAVEEAPESVALPPNPAETKRRRAVGKKSLNTLRKNATARSEKEGPKLETPVDHDLEIPAMSDEELVLGPNDRVAKNFKESGFNGPVGDEARIAELQERLQRTAYSGGHRKPETRKEARAFLGKAAEELAPKPEVVEERQSYTPPRNKTAKRVQKFDSYKDERSRLEDQEKDAKKAYFEKLTQFQKSRSDLSVAAERFHIKQSIDKDSDMPDEVRSAEREWMKAKAAVTKLSLESVASRKRRTGSLERQDGTVKHAGEEYTKKLMERYHNIHLVRESVFGVEAETQKARAEALRSRDRTFIDKAIKTFGKLPPEVALGFSMAMIGGGAVGTVLTGGAAMIPLLALSGVGSTATLMRYAAEKAKQRGDYATYDKLSKIGGGVSKFTIGGTLNVGTRAVGKAIGSIFSRKQNEILENRKVGDLTDVDVLLAEVKKRERAGAAKHQIEGVVNLAAAGATIAGGIEIGGALHHALAPAPLHAPHDLNSHTPGGHENIQNQPAHAAAIVHPAANAETAPTASAPAAPVAAAPAETVPTAPVGGEDEYAVITHQGQGMDHLFRGLKHNIHDVTTDPSKLSPVSAHLMKLSPSELSHELNAAMGGKEGGASLTMHMDDKVFLDDKDNLWFQANGHDPVLVMHNDPSVTDAAHPGVAVHQFTEELRPNMQHHAEAAPHKEADELMPVQTIENGNSIEVAPQHIEQDVTVPVNPLTTLHGTGAKGTHQPIEHGSSADIARQAKALHEQLKEARPDTFGRPAEANTAQALAEQANANGLKVPMNEAHIYSDAKGHLIAYGGNSQEQLRKVSEFFGQKQNFGKTVLVMSPTPDPITGKPDVVPFISDERGLFGPNLIIRDESGNPILPPTQNDLVQKVL